MSLFDQFRNDQAGAALLVDWIGAGGHVVTQLKAEHRGFTCTQGDNGKPCPLNKEPNWWERVKSVIADTIRRQLEIKEKVQLRVACEDDLNMCAACGCCLRLKVWTPTEHIKAHVDLVRLQKAPSWCWILKELRSS